MTIFLTAQKAMVVSFVAVALLCSATTLLAQAPPGPPAQSPRDEQASFELADDALTIELVAAEPDVVSPVAMCWDAEGALYVAEMRDYPAGPTAGKIRRLTDRDGDGRYETSTIFGEGLNFPNGLLCLRDGLLVTAAPDILFLRDTDNDGRADERTVIFTGFGEGNQQLRANGLVWGLDNWIYGANGRSDGVIRRPGEMEDKGISIRTRDYRFRPDFSEFQAVTGQSQFGQTRDDWGNRFLSWNTIPLRQQLFDEADLSRNPQLARYAVHDLANPTDTGEVFPISQRPQTFNRESTNHYNALCGLTIFRGDALGEAYVGDVFVGESLSSLVVHRRLTAQSPTFVANRVEATREFLASRDSWFHPVFHTTGPDGALYIADFYRRWVEHPQFVVGAWRETVDWREGVLHGRIWRVRRREGIEPRPTNLKQATTEQLVATLADRNGWRRDTAARLLFERKDAAAVVPLAKSLAGKDARAAVQALWLLASASGTETRWVPSGLTHGAAEVRRQAVIASAPHWLSSAETRDLAVSLVDDPDFGVRFEVARALGSLPEGESCTPLVALSKTPDPAGWLARALSASAAPQAGEFITALAEGNSPWLHASTSAQAAALEQLAEVWMARGDSNAAEACLALLLTDEARRLGTGQLAILAGAARVWSRRPTVWNENSPAANKLRERLIVVALDSTAPADDRARAVQVLGEIGAAPQIARLLPLVADKSTGALADAVVVTICKRGDAAAAGEVFAAWASYTPTRRRTLSSAALASPTASRAFVEALEQGVARAAEIDPALRTTYAKLGDPELAARADRIFAAAAPAPRDEVLTKYRAALDLAGDRTQGAALFKAHCSTCHVMFGVGRQVGPDLSGIAARPRETLLADLLDPSRQVGPDYLSYSLQTSDGRALTGILVSDTEKAVTLRRGEGADDTVLKSDIEELFAAGKSLMPEGFEQRLTLQNVADLLAFLSLPERKLLEQP